MNKNFYEIGCRKCGKGGDYKIFTDGKGKFKAEHFCGHISGFEVVIEINKKVKAIDLRMVV